VTLSLIPDIHRATHAIALALSSHPKLDVTQAEGHILAHLHESTEARISELHARFGHRRSTLTSVLDRLEQRGLIERTGDRNDRRAFVITLTRSGRTSAAAVHRILATIESEALSGVSDAQRTHVTSALDAIAASAAKPRNLARRSGASGR
jgi:DNA-binding MarR family transcriptional regulator